MSVQLEGVLGYALLDRFSNYFRLCKRHFMQESYKLITTLAARCSLIPYNVSNDPPTFGD